MLANDRARQNLDRHPSYVLAAYMASGTSPSPRLPDSSSEISWMKMDGYTVNLELKRPGSTAGCESSI
jgi:hypothetical protein